MRVDLSNQKISLKQILLGLKWYVVLSFLTIFSIALVMSKMHPERISYAKEYHYLYSMIDDLDKGNDVNFDIIKDKLSLFSSLHPEVDTHFIKKYLRDSDYIAAETVLEGIHKRVPIENEVVETFSNASLKIEQTNMEEAYQKALTIKDNVSLKETFPILYTYNLYRISLIEEIRGDHETAILTAHDLSKYIESMQGTANFANPLVKRIYKKINK